MLLPIHNQEELGSSMWGPLWNQRGAGAFVPRTNQSGAGEKQGFLWFSEAGPSLGSRRLWL